MDISPRITLISCGNSSIRKARKYLPTVVMRLSLLVDKTGPDFASAVADIVLNFKIENSR